MPNDSELLHRYDVEKSADAFTEFVRRHIDFVYASALRLVGGDAHHASDVTQDVFTAAARVPGALAQYRTVKGWLYITTRNVAANLVRAEHLRRRRETEAHMLHAISTGEEDAGSDELRPVLDAALAALNEKDREVVFLRFFEGQGYPEIARHIATTADAARQRVDRALEKMRDALGRRGVASTTAALSGAMTMQAAVTAPVGLAATVSASALTGGALSFFALMSTTKATTTLASIIALLALGIAYHESIVAREATGDLQALRRKQSASLEVSPQRAASTTHPPQSSVTVGVRESEAGVAPTTLAGRYDYILDHPEARVAFLQHAALTARARYLRFFRSAGLSSDQQDKFLQNLMDETEEALKLSALQRTNPDAVKATKNELEAKYGNIERAILGDQWDAEVKYLQSLPERNVADALAAELYATQAPLTGEQAEKLTQILSENRYSFQGAPSDTSTMNGAFISQDAFNSAFNRALANNFNWLRDAPVTDAAYARAAEVLAPAQLAALRLLQAEQASRLQLPPAVQ